MTGPSLQQSNGAFLAQGVAVRQADYLINLALRVLRDHRKDVREFLPLQAAAANAHADIKAGGQNDMEMVARRPHWNGADDIDTGETAHILGCSHRHAQRLHADLDGHFTGGRWRFDRRTVQSYAAARNRYRRNPAA